MGLRHWLAAAAIALPIGAVHATDLRIGYTADALTLDPANHRSRETETLLRLIYDGITTHDPAMKVVPELAESWRQVDPVTYEFKLRQGVKFHSGEEFTADDVVFTFTRLFKTGALDGQTSPRKSLLGPLKDVQKVDKYTVRFVLSAPWPVFPAMLTFQEVVSRNFAEKVGTKGLATQENGTGPFKLLEWRHGDSMVLQRFKDYFGGSSEIPSAGKACVDHLIVKIIPENASRVAALLAGDVDLINELPVFDMKQVAANPNTRVATVNGTRTFFVALNTNKPPFNDIRVRQAANHALNRKLIIDRILNGTAVPLNGVMSPDAFGYNPHLPAYDYNVKEAKAELAASGHPNGLDVTLDVDGAHKETAEAIAAVLTQTGIRTKVAVGEASQLRARWSPDGTRQGDMYFTSWGNGSLDPSDIFVPTLRTKGRGNSAGYSNPKVDHLLDAAETETDPAKRAAMYQEAQAVVNHDAPWIFLWLPEDIYGVSKRLTGWQPSADGRLNLRDACVQ